MYSTDKIIESIGNSLESRLHVETKVVIRTKGRARPFPNITVEYSIAVMEALRASWISHKAYPFYTTLTPRAPHRPPVRGSGYPPPPAFGHSRQSGGV